MERAAASTCRRLTSTRLLRMRGWSGVGVVLWLWLGTHLVFLPRAAAEEPLLRLPEVTDAALVPAAPVFDYEQISPPNYLRAALEEAALLGIGFTEYVVNHDLNSQDWDFTYDWSGLRKKLGPTGYSFDTNGFDTNFIRHPAAGIMYYWAARSNRLSILASTAMSTSASLLWEYIGELRERASINDMLVTPLAGVVLGEMTLQLAAFFDRSCDTLPNRVLGAVLGPMKSVHDIIDAAQLRRDTRCDAHGLSLRGDHSFQFSFGVGPLATVAGPHVPTRLTTRLGMHTRIVAVHTYGTPGEGTTTFADGNVTEFRLSGMFGGGTWLDFTLQAGMMPIGMHYRALAAGRGGLWGHELLFGLWFGTEYRVHRFGWSESEARQLDRFFELDIPGVGIHYRKTMGVWSLDLELQAAVAMLGIDALARAAYLEGGAPTMLPSVAQYSGYNYAIGFRLTPRALLRSGGFELGAALSAVRGEDVTIRDRFGDEVHYVSGSEQRITSDVWASYGPQDWLLRLQLMGSLLSRVSQLAGVEASRAELRLLGGVGAQF